MYIYIYKAPAGFQNQWSTADIKQHVTLRPPNLPGKPQYHSKDSGIQHYRNLTGISEDEFYVIQKTYLEMLSYTDWTFGELLKGLDKSGLQDQTAVFFSSDHGDTLINNHV